MDEINSHNDKYVSVIANEGRHIQKFIVTRKNKNKKY